MHPGTKGRSQGGNVRGLFTPFASITRFRFMDIISAGVVRNASTPEQVTKVGPAGTIRGARGLFSPTPTGFLVEIN